MAARTRSPAMPACSIVVPVRNEAAILPVTVTALLAATWSGVRILWVCNGCTDGSAALIRALAGDRGEVLERDPPGKTAALQAGDEVMGALFPRIYLDADTWIDRNGLMALLAPLAEGRADLTAPAHDFDLQRASSVSRAISACWQALPFARDGAFSRVLALSQAGRARWGEWQQIAGDDMFVAAMVPPERRRMIPEAVATTLVPADFAGWVRMRARWLRGERELVALGLVLPKAKSQRRALLVRLLAPRHMFGALCFIAARLIAEIPARSGKASHWRPDRR